MSHRKSSDKTELEKRLEAEAQAAGEAQDGDGTDAAAADGSEDVAEAPVVDMELVDAPDDAAQASEEAARQADDRVDALEAALAEAREEAADLRDQLLRRAAELDNYRKRTARETERIRQTAAERLLRDLLPVLDHIDLALEHADSDSGLAEGVEMVAKQFREVVERHGMTPVPALGEPFDPNVHEALTQREDGSVPAHTVVEVYQKGYMLGGRLLRPAKVIVSTGGPEPAAPAESESEQEDAPDDTASADVGEEA